MKRKYVIALFLCLVLLISHIYSNTMIYVKSDNRIIRVGIIDGQIPNELTVNSQKNVLSKATKKDLEHGYSVFSIFLQELERDNSNEAIENIEIYNAVVLENGFSSQDNIIKGIDWCIGKEVEVINLSIAIGKITPELTQAMERAKKKGILLMIADGNLFKSSEELLQQENVLLVGMSDKKKKDIKKIYFPGKNICYTDSLGERKVANGTSYSTAYGTATLVKELSRVKGMTLKEKRDYLISFQDHIKNRKEGRRWKE